MIRKFNTRLLFTDTDHTDNLCYELHGRKPHKKFTSTKNYFILSNQKKDSKYFCADNKKVLGKMKDEYGGKSVVKFVGLKSKI